MEVFQGIGSSEGIAIGKTLIIESSLSSFPRVELDSERAIKEEIKRLRQAQKQTEKQLVQTEKHSSQFMPKEMKTIFITYRLFLKDKRLVPAAEEQIRQLRINAEWAFTNIIIELKEEFAKLKDSYIRTRFDDIRQLAEQLMNNLQNRTYLGLGELKEPVILLCQDISPADAFHLSREKILGIASQLGGETSHTSIIARALGIPAVVGVQGIIHRTISGAQAVVDGTKGEVIYEPNQKTLQQKLERINKIHFFQNKLQDLATQSCRLACGRAVELAANLDYMEELDQIHDLHIESIGLIRTEFLFIGVESSPTEEQQTQVYSHILQKNQGKPVTIRTWDIGADKTTRFSKQFTEEANPALGLRATRACLKDTDFMRTQLRAILQASKISHIRIMLPMITNLEEVVESKKILDEEADSLQIDPTSFSFGCMIETPSSALIVGELLEVSDFISIGSNDLVQYILAIDRMNEHVADMYTPFHPAILQLLERVVAQANQRKVPVSICGEMASDPFMQMFLLGVGQITFSMSPNRILRTKEILRGVDDNTCKKIAFRFLSKRTLRECTDYLHHLRKVYLKDIVF